MKKAMIFVSIGIFLFGIVLPILLNAAGKGFNLGVNFGGMPIAGTFNGYSIGGEIGFQFSERLAFMGEVEYGYQSYSHESRGEYYLYSDEMNLSTVPISGTLVFITPIGEKFSARIGAGLGYYLIKINQTSRETSTYSESESEEETKDINGIAPHVSFGIEASISKYTSIYGEVKYSVGKAVLEEDNTYWSSKSDLLFGGPQVKIGFRFYFK